MSSEGVADELAGIDLSPLDELTRLKTEIDTLDLRLEQMEQRKASVAEAVYQRVRGDYESKRRSLEQESAPLKAAARAQYVKLFALLSRSEADHEAARLDREEVEFRHSLGEFDDDEFKRRLAGIDDQLATKSAVRERALELRGRFVAAFKSEEELGQTGAAATSEPALAPAPPAADVTRPPPSAPRQDSTVLLNTPLPAATAPDYRTPPPSPAPDPTAATVRMTPLTPEQLAAAAPPPPAPATLDPGATQAMRVLKGDAATPPRADQTVIIRGARLVPQNAEAGKITHTVGLKPVIIGSAESCDVRVAGARPQHAEIRVSMAGYTVSDLGGGVRINGVVIEQHLMRHDDTLEIGPARFSFREG